MTPSATILISVFKCHLYFMLVNVLLRCLLVVSCQNVTGRQDAGGGALDYRRAKGG